MKKIIGGKRYDTTTATRLAEWDSPHARSDFNFFEETLYQKRTGEYFLHGEGGPASKYAERCQSGWTGGEMLIPLDPEEAQDWAEAHLDGDEYETIFGEVPEEENSHQLCAIIKETTYRALRDKAREKGCSIGKLIDEMTE